MPFDGGAFVYTLIWYVSGVGSVLSSKQIINSYPFPFTMCLVQFFFAAMCSLGYLHAWKLRREINPENLRLIFIIAVAYAFGFIFYNLSMEYGETAPLCP
jgi:drug/metabolite transporter (DMT)-like permease